MFGHFGYIEASEHTFADQLFESFGRVRFEVVGPSRSSSIQNDVNHEVFSQDSHHMGVSINGGTPKSSILMGSSLLNQPLFFSPIYGNPISFFTIIGQLIQILTSPDIEFRLGTSGWELLHQSLYQLHLHAGRIRQDLPRPRPFWAFSNATGTNKQTTLW